MISIFASVPDGFRGAQARGEDDSDDEEKQLAAVFWDEPCIWYPTRCWKPWCSAAPGTKRTLVWAIYIYVCVQLMIYRM
jgi:hypothetical protein